MDLVFLGLLEEDFVQDRYLIQCRSVRHKYSLVDGEISGFGDQVWLHKSFEKLSEVGCAGYGSVVRWTLVVTRFEYHPDI